MSVSENTLHPLQIEDAREAAHQASENQRGCEDRIKKASRDLAQKERTYREKLSKRILALHAGEGDTPGLAISTCETVAKGEKEVSRLRYERDVAAGIFEATKQEAFRRGADRRDVDTLLHWSMRRDLRVDTPPVDWDRQTGEVREPVGATA